MVRNAQKNRTPVLNVERAAWVEKFLSKRQKTLPPDPNGWNASCAARAKKVIDSYLEIYPEADRQSVLLDLLHDLLHLCDRDPKLGDLDERLVDALYCYAEGIWDTSLPGELSRLLRRR